MCSFFQFMTLFVLKAHEPWPSFACYMGMYIIFNFQVYLAKKKQKGIEKVKRNIMIQPISLGGVGMVDINLFNQALIGSWAQRFSGAGSIENNWTLIPNWIFLLFGENCLILKYNCYCDNIASLFDKNIPLFYKELLKLTLNFNHSNSF